MVSAGDLRQRGTKRFSDAEDSSSSKRVQVDRVQIDNSVSPLPARPTATKSKAKQTQSQAKQNQRVIAAASFRPAIPRPSIAETWHVFGDNLSKAYLQSASTLSEYKIACRYFHARLALVARGFIIGELEQIFASCRPPFLEDSDDFDLNVASREFEDQYNWVEDRLVERLRGYAKFWLKSPGGSCYRDQYLNHKQKKKAAVPAPPIPDHNSITQYQGKACLKWKRTQLIDVWLPCLAALETLPSSDGSNDSISWIHGDAENRWYNVLDLTARCLVIEFAKLYLNGEVVNGKKGNEKEYLFRPAIRKILRTYMTFPPNSPDFSESVRAQLIIKKNSMKTPMDLSSLEPIVDPEGNGDVYILDAERFSGDPLALHVREERQMEEELLADQERIARTEGQAEDTLMQQHVQEVAKIIEHSHFRYAKHDLMSLRQPVIAAEDESHLAKAYRSKGIIGRIIQVRAEAKLERERISALIMHAMGREALLDKEMKLLEKEAKIHAAAVDELLAQQGKNGERERLIRERRAALDADTFVVPLEGQSSQAPPPQMPSGEDENADEAGSKEDGPLVRKQRLETDMVHQKACTAALTDYAIGVWPGGTDRLMFSDALRQRIACAGARIASVEDLRKELYPACILETSSLKAHAEDIVKIISSTVPVRAQDNGLNAVQEAIHSNEVEQSPGNEQERGSEGGRVRGRGRGGGRPRGSRVERAEREKRQSEQEEMRSEIDGVRGRGRGRPKGSRAARESGRGGQQSESMNRTLPGGLVPGGELLDWEVLGGLYPNQSNSNRGLLK